MQVLSDKSNDRKGKLQQHLSQKVFCSVTKYLKVTFKGLMLLKKVISSYLDLTNDIILISAVVTVLNSGQENFSWDEFSTFPFQILMVLSISIFVPLVNSAITIAYKRPLVILSAEQANHFTEKTNPIIFAITRTIIIFFSL